jgi:hypothetical protein
MPKLGTSEQSFTMNFSFKDNPRLEERISGMMSIITFQDDVKDLRFFQNFYFPPHISLNKSSQIYVSQTKEAFISLMAKLIGFMISFTISFLRLPIHSHYFIIIMIIIII